MEDFKPRLVAYTDEEIARIRKHTEVCDIDRKKLEPWQILNIAQTRRMADDIRARYLDLRGGGPQRSDDDLRAEIRATSREWASFADDSHATVFSHLTRHDVDDRVLACIRSMCDIRVEFEAGGMTEEQAERKARDTADVLGAAPNQES